MRKGSSPNKQGASKGKLLGWLTALPLLTLASTFPNDIWPFELAESFLPQLAAITLAAGILAFKNGQRTLLLSSAVALLLACWRLSPQISTGSARTDVADINVATINLYHPNDRHEEVRHVLKRIDADVTCLIEVSMEWDSLLSQSLSSSHPYSVRVPTEHCCWGIAVYSRHAILSDSIHYWTRDPVIRITVKEGDELDIWVMHTRPPIFPNDTEERDRLMWHVATEIAMRARPAVLLGDLNIVPWAASFRNMAETAGMRSSRRWLMPTYPMHFQIPLIPIDHILHTQHLVTVSCRTEVIPGSDHKGMVAGLRWQD